MRAHARGSEGPRGIFWDTPTLVLLLNSAAQDITAIKLILVDPPRKGMNRAGLERFVGQAQRLTAISAHINILITGSERLRELNRYFRKKDKPTDVLSFPQPQEKGGGDIAISAEIAAENAARYGHSFRDELKVLILHGILHLAGYDHERDNGEMAARERTLRKRLGLPAALIERSGKGKLT